MDLHNFREDYRQKALNEAECLPDPLEQFRQWLQEAIDEKLPEPTAMNIATVENGRPSSRMVLLKEVNEQGFVFFTNYQSRKGREIAQNPNVALTFFWAQLERQVRVEGRIEKLPTPESDAYFASRPYSSRIGAWASAQSQEISGHAQLLANAAKLMVKYPLHVPRPEHWGGYVIVPEYIEFWQGRPSRLHDRICYQRQNNNWRIARLSP